MLEYIKNQLNEAKWHKNQVEKIKKEVEKYSEIFGIEIDYNKLKVIEDSDSK